MTDIKQALKPGYFNNKPLLRAIFDVKRTIGLQDSCIQTNQISIIFLEEQAKQSGDVDNFIRSLCKEKEISLGTRDLQYFKTIQYKSYILQTYNLVEPFFKELNSQYRFYNSFNGNWKTKIGDKNLDPFNQLLENLPEKSSAIIKSYPEFHLLNYYRLIRNSIVHLQEDAEQHKKTSKYYLDNLHDKLEFFKENYEIAGPNEPNNISFADFMLYTRAIKYFGNIINDSCFPDNNSLVAIAQKDEVLQKRLR